MPDEVRNVMLRRADNGAISVIVPKNFSGPAWPFRIQVSQVPSNVSDERVADVFWQAAFTKAIAAITWQKLSEAYDARSG